MENWRHFSDIEHIHPYNEPENVIFQVLLSHFILNKTVKGIKIDIEIEDSMPSIRNNSGKSKT